MPSRYQPLSEAGKNIKRALAPCVEMAVLLEELTAERADIASRGFPEEAELSARIDTLFSDLAASRREVGRMIHEVDSLTSLERRVLRLRYLCAEPWEVICLRLHRERGCVFTTYRSALNKLGQVAVLENAG